MGCVGGLQFVGFEIHAWRKFYGRYMDDGYLIHEDIDYLKSCKTQIETVCSNIGLTLNTKKTRIIPLADGFKFLKTRFIVTDTGEIVLKMNHDSTTIMRRKLRAFKSWVDEGKFTLVDVRSAYDSYQGHMKRGNSFVIRQQTDHYFKSIFGFYPNKKGWMRNV